MKGSDHQGKMLKVLAEIFLGKIKVKQTFHMSRRNGDQIATHSLALFPRSMPCQFLVMDNVVTLMDGWMDNNMIYDSTTIQTLSHEVELSHMLEPE